MENIYIPHGFDLIVPVPLHKTRLKQRGFNQALLLAKGLAETFGIPLYYDDLVRTRATRPQVELSVLERIDNVRGAFAMSRQGGMDGRAVLLVDDVFTTGATLNECSRVLKKSGAARVTAFTIARAV